MKPKLKMLYSPAQLAAAVARMGRAISRDCGGRLLDVVIILENAFVFGGDLIRKITCPINCHFVRAETRDVQVGGFERKEIFFSNEPDLSGRDVLLVDAVLHSGVTLDFLIKRISESKPRSVQVAVLFDKPQERVVDLKPEYFGFAAASSYLVGYGLPDGEGRYRNLACVGAPEETGAAAAGKKRGRKAGQKGKG